MNIAIIACISSELAEQLTSAGVAFTPTPDPDSILAAYERQPNSLLLLEATDPAYTRDILHTLRQTVSQTALPCLAVVEDDDIDIALAAGATDVLRMPLSIAALQARVNLIAQQLPQALSGSMDLLIHDFNSPLGITEYSLNLLLEILAEGEATLPELEQLTRNVLRSNLRMRALLFDLLDYTRLLHGSYDLVLRSFDPLALTDRIITEASKIAHENNISIALDIDEDHDVMTAQGDEELLGRALHAALDTAIKFCQPGSDIIVSPFQEDGMFHLQVADNGQPLAPQFSPEQLFDLSLASAMREQGSRTMVGISLPFCRAALQAMHGDATVTSSPHRTVVTLSVPA